MGSIRFGGQRPDWLRTVDGLWTSGSAVRADVSFRPGKPLPESPVSMSITKLRHRARGAAAGITAGITPRQSVFLRSLKTEWLSTRKLSRLSALHQAVNEYRTGYTQ